MMSDGPPPDSQNHVTGHNVVMSTTPSESAVSKTIQKGLLENGAVYVGAGLLIGSLASIVLAPGGRGTASRKVITAFGTGIGVGSAWTRTNMDLENMLGEK
jgi:hypothetical protein